MKPFAELSMKELCELSERNRAAIPIARAALRPFAAFADRLNLLPDDHVITQGSPMAKRQLRMGECRNAEAAHDLLESLRR